MKDFIERLIQARMQDPRQQELAGRGSNIDRINEAFGNTDVYDKQVEENPMPPSLGETMGSFIKKLLSIRGN